MNDRMVEAWNSVVSCDDVVFHLGDFSLNLPIQSDENKLLLARLSGKKHFIRGNHDKNTDEFYKEAGFLSVHESVNLGGVLLIHYPLQEAIARKIKDSHWGIVEHVVHGHSHSKDCPNYENHFNVAVDRHEFFPVPYTTAVPFELHNSFFQAVSQF
jgi:calcineurin-like phosphoesterase family protein